MNKKILMALLIGVVAFGNVSAEETIVEDLEEGNSAQINTK
jgi:hypothetical protein